MLSAWKTGGSDHAGADPLKQANERRAERLGAGTEREQVSDQIYYARKLKTMILYMPACHLANGEKLGLALALALTGLTGRSF
jgi:hypothetical protein